MSDFVPLRTEGERQARPRLEGDDEGAPTAVSGLNSDRAVINAMPESWICIGIIIAYSDSGSSFPLPTL